MSKHTPGPWKVEPCPCGRCSKFIINPVIFCQEGALGEDDARLIAAAPDLLEACREALTVIRTHIPTAQKIIVPGISSILATAIANATKEDQ